MVAITVLAVLLGVGLPSFFDFVRNNRLTAQTNDFVNALNLTRSEALKRADAVTICASSDGATCSGSANWSTGWIVFADPNANGTLDGSEVAIQQWPGTTGGITLNALARTFIQYTGTGMSNGTETFSLLKPGCQGNHARQIAISITGRVSSSTVACP